MPSETARSKVPIAAFAYLIRRTSRNRLVAQLKRAKKPVYALALLIGFGYLGLMIWSRTFAASMAGRVPQAVTHSPAEAIAPLGIAFVLISMWVFGSELDALAFTQSEVALLFPAPVTRRALIVYKLIRMQMAVLFSAAIWVFILRRPSTGIPAVAMLVSTFVLFSTLGLHRLGAALVRAIREQPRGDEVSRRRWGPVIASVVFIVVLMSVNPGVDVPDGSSPFAFIDQVAAMLAKSPFPTILYPFHLVTAPTFAHDFGAWGRALLPALLIFAVHFAWVLSMDTAFEEAAVAASERRAKLLDSMRRRRTGTPIASSKPNDKTIALASVGVPAMAIFWKNMLALKRQWTIGTLVRPILIGVFLSFTALRRVHDPALIVAVVTIYLAVMLILAGGQTVRNDLRSDMLHLPFLKTLPLRGREIVMAEVASSALPLTAVQLVLVTITAIALAFSREAVFIPVAIRTGMLVAAPIVLLTVNGAMLTVNNGMAVLFPAWMRLGPAGAGGFEMIGQAMLAMSGMLLGFVLLLAVPGLGGLAMFWTLRSSPALATIAAGVVGSAILALEVYGIIALLGRAFERAEPLQTA